MTLHDNPRRSFIDVVGRLATDAGPDGLTLGGVLDRLDERAFGLIILILSIPCLVPALYGVPQIIGVPIILLAGQLLVGRREPWLPGAMLRRNVPRSWLDRMAGFADKRMRWLERLSRPRLIPLATGLGERVAALFMIGATITIILPMTNTVPSLALALIAVGLIQRDGVFVLAGEALAAAWIGALLVVAIGIAFGAGWAVSLLARVTG